MTVAKPLTNPTAKTFSQYDYAGAAAFIAGGRSKRSRRLASNTYLVHVDEHSIALVLHSTAVITYHDNGDQTLYYASWKTRTTGMRFASFAAARMWSENSIWHIRHASDGRTPDKFIKCRSRKHGGKYGDSEWSGCKGTGQATYIERCSGGTRHEWQSVDGRLQHVELAAPRPCRHGHIERHALPATQVKCHRCDGTGRENIGNKQITTPFPHHAVIRTDATGKVLSTEEPKPYAPAYDGPAKTSNYPSGHYGHHTQTLEEPTAPSAHYDLPDPHQDLFGHTMSGDTVQNYLGAVIPGIDTYVTNPAAPDRPKRRIMDVVVNLNDDHGWTREQIADWLDTLDADLRFTA